MSVEIRQTTVDDLDDVMRLWNDGDVMRFVGFPDGLGVTRDRLDAWLPWATAPPARNHFTITADDVGYSGEAFYAVDPDTGTAALDIKLVPAARGRCIGTAGLSHAITEAFAVGGARRAYVDPEPQNTKAWALYARLGFTSRPRPTALGDGPSYLEITAAEWDALTQP